MSMKTSKNDQVDIPQLTTTKEHNVSLCIHISESNTCNIGDFYNRLMFLTQITKYFDLESENNLFFKDSESQG